MNVHVQFFSRLRELAGVSEMKLQVPEATKVTELLEILYSRTPALRDWDKSIIVAAGVDFVGRDYILQRDDQISIMPPVQGG
ncbi:MAG TPA: MoaD/ThiS family protein [Chthoniobacterales bacterium]